MTEAVSKPRSKPSARADSSGAPETRQRNPERTRAAILEAAVAEFAAHGLGGARIDAIAARAGVNKRMLYHYFGNKEALFTAALLHTYEDIRHSESALHLESMEPVAAIARLIDFTFDYFLDHPHFISMLNTENMHRARYIQSSGRGAAINIPLVQTLEGVLRRGAAQGVFRDGVDPVQLYVSIAGICYFYFSNIHTLSTIFERDLAARPMLDARKRHVLEVILGYLRP